MSSSVINVYYSINAGKMFKQTLVSLISLCETNKENILNVWVLDCEVPEYSPKIKKLSNTEISILQSVLTNANPSNKLHYYDVSDLLRKYMLGGINESKDSYLKGYSFISMLFVRYLIPFIPDIPSKMLWLDSDVIIMKNLAELWNIDISNYAWGGCKDIINFGWGSFSNTHRKWMKKIHGVYLQNGIMLLNLNKNSPNDISECFKNIIINYRYENYYFMDEVNIIKNKLVIKNNFNSFQPTDDTYIFHACAAFFTNSIIHKLKQCLRNIIVGRYRSVIWILSKKRELCDQKIKPDNAFFYELYKQFQWLKIEANKILSLINEHI